jgi:hypothetical protein
MFKGGMACAVSSPTTVGGCACLPPPSQSAELFQNSPGEGIREGYAMFHVYGLEVSESQRPIKISTRGW